MLQSFRSNVATDDPSVAVDVDHFGTRPGGISSLVHPVAFRMVVVAEGDADGVAVVTSGAGENDDRGDGAIACEVAAGSGASALACTYWD